MPAGERRPIAARGWRTSQQLAAALIVRGASPDAISLLGMGAGLLAGACLAATASQPVAWLLWPVAALLIQLRLLANMLDGMVAVGRGIASPLGELYNEVPDRVSDTAALAGLGVASGSIAWGLAAALAAMATAYVRTTARAAGAPADFGGWMPKQRRMFVVTVFALLAPLLPAAARPGIARGVLAGITLLALVTAGQRLARAARALRGQA